MREVNIEDVKVGDTVTVYIPAQTPRSWGGGAYPGRYITGVVKHDDYYKSTDRMAMGPVLLTEDSCIVSHTPKSPQWISREFFDAIHSSTKGDRLSVDLQPAEVKPTASDWKMAGQIHDLRDNHAEAEGEVRAHASRADNSEKRLQHVLDRERRERRIYEAELRHLKTEIAQLRAQQGKP